jgi:hypothetical protein
MAFPWELNVDHPYRDVKRSHRDQRGTDQSTHQEQGTAEDSDRKAPASAARRR